MGTEKALPPGKWISAEVYLQRVAEAEGEMLDALNGFEYKDGREIFEVQLDSMTELRASTQAYLRINCRPTDR